MPCGSMLDTPLALDDHAVPQQAPSLEAKAEGVERRHVTVMFSDLVGSTALSLAWTQKTYARTTI
jgi:class 3 adenylate cyclase